MHVTQTWFNTELDFFSQLAERSSGFLSVGEYRAADPEHILGAAAQRVDLGAVQADVVLAHDQRDARQ